MDPKEIIQEIFETSFKLSQDDAKVIATFDRSGISVEGKNIVKIEGDALSALKTLLDNLSVMPIIKISAKQIIRKSGISL